MTDSKPLYSCPRCGKPGTAWEKCRKPNGAIAWFCRDCGYIGDAQSISEAAAGMTATPAKASSKALKKGGKEHVAPQ